MPILGGSFDAAISTPVRERRSATSPQSLQSRSNSLPSFLSPGKANRSQSISISRFSSPSRTTSSHGRDIGSVPGIAEFLSPDDEIWDSSADLQLEGIPQLRAQPSRDTVRANSSSNYPRHTSATLDTSRSSAFEQNSQDQGKHAARLERKLVFHKPGRLRVRESCDLVLVGAPVNVALDIFGRLAEAMRDQQWNKRNAGEWSLVWRDGPVLYEYDHSSVDFSALPTSSDGRDRVYLQWYLSDGSTVESPARESSSVIVPLSAPFTRTSCLQQVKATKGAVRASFRRKRAEVSHPLIPRMLDEVPLEWLFYAANGALQPLQKDLVRSLERKAGPPQSSLMSRIVVVTFAVIALATILCLATEAGPYLLDLYGYQPKATAVLASTNTNLGPPTFALLSLAVALGLPLPLWRAAGQRLRQTAAHLQSAVYR